MGLDETKTAMLSKGRIDILKRQHTGREKNTSHKRLILKFSRKLKRLNIQKLYHPINKWKNKLKTFFNKRDSGATEIIHSSAAKMTCFSSRGFRINSSTHMAVYKTIQYLLASSGSR